MTAATRRDLIASFVCFAMLGVVAGSWFARIPAARDHLDADLWVVGLVLLGLGVGSLITMPLGGRLSHRFSSRKVCLVTGLWVALFYCLLPLAGSPVLFGLLLLLAGTGVGLWQVMLNVHAVSVERAVGRSVMPALHGLWSGGVILGSALGAVMAAAGIGFGTHFLLVLPAVGLINVVGASCWQDHREVTEDGSHVRPTMKALTLPVVLLAVMLLCSNIGEGTVSDWLALYAHDERGFGPGLAAAAFTTYSVTSTVGRLLGGFVVDRLGHRLSLRLSGLVTAAGIGTVVYLPGDVGPFLGAALWGIGLAVVFPTAITIAGSHGGDNSAGAVSAVTTMGFGAFLTGPPLIGLLAEVTSIGFALTVVMVLSLGVTLLAGAVTARRASPQQHQMS